MSVRTLIIFAVACWLGVGRATADELLYRYVCDVAPYEYDDPEDEYDAWINGTPCENSCVERVESGHYILQWPQGAEQAGHDLTIAEPPEEPPPTLWVEWRFRSNHPLGPNFYSCDGEFAVRYRWVSDTVNMYGDAAISFGGNHAVLGLDIEEFHTYRFESPDGHNYTFAVDGQVFVVDYDDYSNGYNYIQMRGYGGCDGFSDVTNEWDYIRFGTISSGEQIVSSNPPSGALSPTEYPNLDRFTVTFNDPNYVYIDDITVTVTGGEVPVITQTRRRENDGPETVQIVLDRPIALNETTTFEFDTGASGNVIEYYYLPLIETDIPTMSTWGLLTLAVLLLAAGAYVFAKRPPSAPAQCPPAH